MNRASWWKCGAGCAAIVIGIVADSGSERAGGHASHDDHLNRLRPVRPELTLAGNAARPAEHRREPHRGPLPGRPALVLRHREGDLLDSGARRRREQSTSVRPTATCTPYALGNADLALPDREPDRLRHGAGPGDGRDPLAHRYVRFGRRVPLPASHRADEPVGGAAAGLALQAPSSLTAGQKVAWWEGNVELALGQCWCDYILNANSSPSIRGACRCDGGRKPHEDVRLPSSGLSRPNSPVELVHFSVPWTMARPPSICAQKKASSLHGATTDGSSNFNKASLPRGDPPYVTTMRAAVMRKIDLTAIYPIPAFRNY